MPVLPTRGRGLVFGLSLAILNLLLSALLLWRISQEPIGLASFTAGILALALLALALAFVYWTYCCWTLMYQLEPDRLVIRWAGNTLEVPLGGVQGLVPGAEFPLPRMASGIHWPGFHLGRGSVQEAGELREVHLFSAHAAPADLLYLVTDVRVYGISVPDPPVFADEIRRLREPGRMAAQTATVEERVRRWHVWDSPIWQDRPLQALLLLALAVNVVHFGYQSWLIPALPEIVALHVTPLGIADSTGPRELLLALPVIGALVMVANTTLGIAFYRWERFASYLLVASVLPIEGLLFSGTLQLLA